MTSIQKITPNLWFDNRAEEAAQFYASIFPESSINRITRFTKDGYEHHHQPEGTVMTIEFQLCSQQFIGLNGGPHFKFNEAISFIVKCDDQDEVDYYWEKLGDGGDPNAQQCGWLKDKFGVSWQIVPKSLTNMMFDSDPKRAGSVIQSLLQMKKIDLRLLEKVYSKA